MKCYLHNELDAVASCNCGRGLCNSCAGNLLHPPARPVRRPPMKDLSKKEKAYYYNDHSCRGRILNRVCDHQRCSGQLRPPGSYWASIGAGPW